MGKKKASSSGRSQQPNASAPREAEQQMPEQPGPQQGLEVHEADQTELPFMAQTPVRHRSKGSLPGDLKWDHLLGQQLQTPERHRHGTSLASWLASPTQPHFGSPCLFSNLEPVPLFQSTPKQQRNFLASPQQHSGVNSFGNIFGSPAPNDLHTGDLLRFETPSSKPGLGGILSPSPRRSRRLTSGGQQRKRAVSLEAMGWLPSLGLPGRADSIADAQHMLHDSGEDVEGDLVKDLLQSPGPKEIQQLTDARMLTRSRGHVGPSDPAAADGAAAEAGSRPSQQQQSRRRALDFSRADSMHQDLQGLAGRSRSSSRHGSAHGEQQQEPLPSRFQPHLPLIPLDLSECGKHVPDQAAAAAGGSSGITPRRRSARHTAALEAAFTSDRKSVV